MVNIYCQSQGDMDVSHSNETSTATNNKEKTFTLLTWKNICIAKHAWMQNQIQIENKIYIETHGHTVTHNTNETQ